MAISRDPDRAPKSTPEEEALAQELDLQLLNVICDEPGAQVGDATGVSFTALTPGIPAAGDHIILQDGTVCEVRRIHWKVVSIPDSDGRTSCQCLVPNVSAVAKKPIKE